MLRIASCLMVCLLPPQDEPPGRWRGILVPIRPETRAGVRPQDPIICDSDLQVGAGYYTRNVDGQARRARLDRLEFTIRNPLQERREFNSPPVGFRKRRGWVPLCFERNCGCYDHTWEDYTAISRDLDLGHPSFEPPPLWSVIFTREQPLIPDFRDPE